MTYPVGVSRGPFTTRFLGLTVLMLVVLAATVRLGFWQLGVAQDEGRKEAVEAAARLERRPLPEVTRPHAPFAAEFSNRPVSATGTYAAQDQILVIDRRLGGRVGTWVVTPLELDAGGTVAVLRGFVDGRPSAAPEPPPGEVTVTGTLGPSESPRRGTSALPEPQRHSLDLSALVNEWPGDLYNVVLVASDEASGAAASGKPVDAAALTRVPPPRLDAGLNLKNAAYAIQWWVFGLFAAWMWWKIVRADRQAEREVDAEGPDAPEQDAHEEEARV